jgi:hypothetical protein
MAVNCKALRLKSRFKERIDCNRRISIDELACGTSPVMDRSGAIMA